MSAEQFVVTFDLDVEGADGGGNTGAILRAVQEAITGPSPLRFRMTIEPARLAGSEAP